MSALDFAAIANLLNYSRIMEISPNPFHEEKDSWAIYDAAHKFHTARYPFKILYLHSRATRESMERARKAVADVSNIHVVYPPSLRERNAGIRDLFDGAAGTWTTTEYLASFIKDELQQYLNQLSKLKPQYFIDPHIEAPAGLPRKWPNPLQTFLLDKDAEFGRGGLAVLLAEPGQGKTYLSHYLVSRIAGNDRIVPILVDSSQWETLSVADQRDLWKTITHSFRHFDAPISWADGHEDEFLRATLRADLFRIIFDGFDEYILRNWGNVQPVDVLEALTSLIDETDTRIIITSRTSFWTANIEGTEAEQVLKRSRSYIYRLMPFGLEKARNYFQQRLGADRTDNAIRVYRELERHNPVFVGRGFVISLIADLVAAEKSNKLDSGGPASIAWLLTALCEREQLRQDLPISATDQIEVFRLFATETAGGQEPTSELLDFALESTRPDLDLNAREICIEKLKSHPILESPSSTGSWRFRQEQVHIFFLADAICSYSVDDASKLVNRIDLGGSFAQDLGGMVVGILTNKSSQAEATPEIAKLISALTRPSKAASTGRSPGAILAAVLALRAIDHFLPRGTSERKERAELLMRLTGGGAVRNLAFAGVISGFDFRGIRFEHCCFEGVTWANCTFDGSTHFFRCQFKGGSPPANCKGFGSIHVEECQLDEIARAAINAEQIREGKKEYSLEDLRNDINSVVRKFISKGGIGLKTVHERDLIKGTISASRNRDAILDILRATILEEHVISGSGKGYHIRADAREAVKFFAANNVYSGPLREAYERLVSKIMS